MRKIGRAMDGDVFKCRVGKVLKQRPFAEDAHFQGCARPAVKNQIMKLLQLPGPGYVLEPVTTIVFDDGEVVEVREMFDSLL
ncbi:MAG: hypothetical protein WAO00_12105, partial [Chthoniobacterales bacterium]